MSEVFSRVMHMESVSKTVIRSLPKVDLHCHLDGAARPETLLEIAQQAGVPLPADSVEELLPFVQVSPSCRSLEDFLKTFDSFYPVLQSPGAMGRIAGELLEDARQDGVLHVEVRFCPALQASERWSSQDVLAEVLSALDAGGKQTGVSWGVVLCLYRILPAEVNEALADLALAHADRGVVGVDLAGPEGISGAALASAFRRCREGGLPATVHAGEAAGPESIAEAVDLLGASRLGHAVTLPEDEELQSRVLDAGLTLECCLTSNLQTGAVAEISLHPFEMLEKKGHRVTLNTDDPAVSGISLSGEYELASKTWGYDREQLLKMTMGAVEGAFLGGDARADLIQRVETAMASLD